MRPKRRNARAQIALPMSTHSASMGLHDVTTRDAVIALLARLLLEAASPPACVEVLDEKP